LHFALFNRSAGYILKPREMRVLLQRSEATEDSVLLRRSESDQERCGSSFETSTNYRDDFWPPPRERLHRTTCEILSLHNIPKLNEQRPLFSGSRGDCHRYHAELSGTSAPPDHSVPSSTSISLSVHPIGGFCAISDELPLATQTSTEWTSAVVDSNGLNPSFGLAVHCIAAEPHATFLRVVVQDSKHEVAFESVVLGRLRTGFRVLQLRSVLGTRIELAYLLLCISVGSEMNIWPTPRQLRLIAAKEERKDDTQSGSAGTGGNFRWCQLQRATNMSQKDSSSMRSGGLRDSVSSLDST